MAIVRSPNKGYNGVSAGVRFTDGEAECNDGWILEWFKKHGYDVLQNTEDINKNNDTAESPEPAAPKKRAQKISEKKVQK